MSAPRLLDLFCCQGGAGKGYADAGFEVVGVDIEPQPRYPFEFHQGDALEYLASHWMEYDAVHASPPCPRYAPVTAWRGSQDDHPDLVGPTRDALVATGLPWIIENVPAAPLRPDYLLCGTMFGLRIQRHRAFETSWGGGLQPQCGSHVGVLPFMHKGERAFADALGCSWMTNRGGREAIPPAMTEFLGEQLLAHIQGVAA